MLPCILVNKDFHKTTPPCRRWTKWVKMRKSDSSDV